MRSAATWHWMTLVPAIPSLAYLRRFPLDRLKIDSR